MQIFLNQNSGEKISKLPSGKGHAFYEEWRGLFKKGIDGTTTKAERLRTLVPWDTRL